VCKASAISSYPLLTPFNVIKKDTAVLKSIIASPNAQLSVGFELTISLLREKIVNQRQTNRAIEPSFTLIEKT
jgi:hypothetical protein